MLYDTAQVRQFEREHAAKLSPSAVLIDKTKKTAVLTITNPLATEIPVELRLRFYTIETEKGNFVMRVDSTPLASAPSLTRWVKDLPEQITLGPKQTRTITVRIQVPSVLTVKHGEYWAQVVASSPSIKRQIPVVVRQMVTRPDGDTALVQQPAKGNMTIPMTSVSKLVYRPSGTTRTPTVTLRNGSARVLPDGQVEVCAVMRRSGATTIYGRARVLLQTPDGRDTAIAVHQFEVPTGSPSELRPCFRGTLPAEPTRETTATLVIDADNTTVELPIRVPFAGARVVVALKPPTPAAPADSAVVADVAKPARVPLYEVIPSKGPLADQLRREAEAAKKEGKVALVEVGAAWCGPCRIFLASLKDSLMIDALASARVIRIDFDHWGQAFVNSGYTIPAALPAIFVLNDDGSQGRSFDPNEWQTIAAQNGVLDARAMAPPLKQFLSDVRTQKDAATPAPKGAE